MGDINKPRVTNGKIVGQIDATKVPRYSGLTTFAQLPELHEVSDVDVAIVGIPFDSGVSYRPGARFGPSHVRESARLLRPYNPAGDVSPFSQQQVADAGDFPANPFDIEEAIASIHKSYDQLAERAKRIVTIGGDHTITLPILRSLRAKHGQSASFTLMPTLTLGIHTLAPITPTAPHLGVPAKKDCSIPKAACISVFVAHSMLQKI